MHFAPRLLVRPSLFLLLAGAASAQVTTTATPGNFTTISSAILVSGPGDTITIQDNPLVMPFKPLYAENLVIPGSKAPLTITTANGIYPPTVTVDGNLSGSVVRFEGASGTIGHDTILQSLAIVRGTGSLLFFGGPIVGGGIACLDGASPTVRNCIIKDNDAQRGGGVYVGQTNSGAGARLMRNNIRDNEATEYGGGVYIELVQGDSGPGAVFSRSRISDNTAGISGGGLYADNSTNPQMDHCWFVLNKATIGSGSGAYLSSPTDARIKDSMFDRNDCPGYGGGLAIVDGVGVDVEHSTFIDNEADLGGGGIYESGWDPIGLGPTRLWDNLIVGNTTSNGNGGGLLSEGPLAPVVDFCTFAANQAIRGGAISHVGLNLSHSILWGDLQSAGAATAWEHEIHTAAGALAVLHSDVQNSATAPWFGTTNLDIDPQFRVGTSTVCPHASLDLFHLEQVGNPCVNKVSILPATFPSNRSTHPNHTIVDTGAADIGFHYPGPGCI